MESPNAVIFFDGYCNLCNRFVDFLIKVDKDGSLRFGSLQGKTYAEFSKTHPELPQNVDTVVFWLEGKAYVKSRAILKVLEYVGGGWEFVKIFHLLPNPLCDKFYDMVAENRTQWFGKRDTCRLPTPEEKKRFLE